MKKILLTLFACFQLLLLPQLNVFSQASKGWTSSDMYLALRKLNVLGSVLYVAAHPDDENTRLITYFSKDKLYRTGYLSLTRGDGGQNLIGDEQGVELGLIRTQELLAARRIDGGEQFFSRAYDFGYSKNPEETFSKWNKEKILSDVVWVIRKFQPDVIITRFPTTGEGGHGHHTGSAILANEAFTAAADPKRFPEQLKYVQTWQAKRILWNTFNFGGNNTITPDQFRVDVGGYNPLLGKSYGEIAAESRSQHKSQGFGVSASRGESFESFKTAAGSAPVKDLMDDVNLSWKRVIGGAAIEKKVNGLIAGFDLIHPEKSVKGLVNLYKDISQLADGYWKTKKLKEVQELIAQCSGLFIDATTTEQYAVQTDSVKINFSFNNRLGVDAQLEKVVINGFDSSFSQRLVENKNLNFYKTIYVPPSKSITQPYWLANKMDEGSFNVNDPLHIGQPDIDPAYDASIYIKISGESFVFGKRVQYKFTDPVRGEVYQPVVVIPSYTLSISPELFIGDTTVVKYDKIYTSYKSNNPVVVVEQRMLAGRSVSDSLVMAKHQQVISTVRKEYDINPVMKVKSPESVQYETQFQDIYFDRKTKQKLYSLKSIKYDHIPHIVYFKEAGIKINLFSLEKYNKKIGYIIGAGDKVPMALDQMGYEVTLLTEKELARNNLNQFDAIISGIRAYNTNDWMDKYYDKLMNYVRDGGNYIVQYNTSNFISSVKSKIGPYDFAIGRTRVSVEDAAVNILKPDHPVLNFPNKITQEDFRDWVQERSIYHAANWDSKYETIFSMNDPGDKPDEGSLIIAKYGKGYFTYTGLVFFRELPAGVPGAYRLLANIIALNKKKAF